MKRKRQRYTTMHSQLNTAPPTMLQPEPLVDEHSAFSNTLAASASTGLITGVLGLLYHWDYSAAITLSLIPWGVYGAGKFIYMLLILLDDIASLLPERRAADKTDYLSIVKED